MTIEAIKQILLNKITNLHNIRMNAVNCGDLELVVKVDDEINETQLTLDQLNNTQ